MSYVYEDVRPFVFTESGQVMFLEIRDRAARLLSDAGAVRCQELLRGTVGDAWSMLACVDRLVELGELREIPQSNIAGQHRVFFRGSKR